MSKPNKKPKAKRTRIDGLIAAAPTIREQKLIAAFGRKPFTGLAMTVRLWRGVREKLAEHAAGRIQHANEERAVAGLIEKLGSDLSKYCVAAMIHNKPEMFVAIAKEMRLQGPQDDKLCKGGDARLALLSAMESGGAVNLKKIAGEVSNRRDVNDKGVDDRQLRRFLRRWGK